MNILQEPAKYAANLKGCGYTIKDFLEYWKHNEGGLGSLPALYVVDVVKCMVILGMEN